MPLSLHAMLLVEADVYPMCLRITAPFFDDDFAAGLRRLPNRS